MKTIQELINDGDLHFENDEIMNGKFIVKCLYCQEEFNALDGYWNAGENYEYIQCPFCKGNHETRGFI